MGSAGETPRPLLGEGRDKGADFGGECEAGVGGVEGMGEGGFEGSGHGVLLNEGAWGG